MNLLEITDHDMVSKTENTKNLTIDGNAGSYPVYRIRLDQLYYNDKNGRIITWINEYIHEHGENALSSLDVKSKEYSDLIRKFITKDNPTRIKETQKSIEKYKQTEPGVVLADGRVIDGNRRFTCLLNIQEETGKTQYFEACILPFDFEMDSKKIKSLELNLQHRIEEKEAYNPIARLAEVYDCVINPKKKQFTIQEYAENIGAKEKDVKEFVDQANLLIDFLRFINAEGQFYVARELKFDGPMKEIYRTTKNLTGEEKETAQNIAFSYFILQKGGDKSRNIRPLQKILSKDNTQLNSFLREQEPMVKKIFKEMRASEDNPISKINQLRDNGEDIREALDKSITTNQVRMSVKDKIQNIVKFVKEANTKLDSIDLDILPELPEQNRQELRSELEKIQEKVTEILEETVC